MIMEQFKELVHHSITPVHNVSKNYLSSSFLVCFVTRPKFMVYLLALLAFLYTLCLSSRSVIKVYFAHSL